MDLKFICLLCISSVTVGRSYAQIPLGIDGFEAELLPIYEFNGYGMKPRFQDVEKDESSNEQGIYRRHARIQTSPWSKLIFEEDKFEPILKSSRKRQGKIPRQFQRRRKAPRILLKTSTEEQTSNKPNEQLQDDVNTQKSTPETSEDLPEIRDLALNPKLILKESEKPKKPFVKVIADQYMKVINTAHDLNIKTGMERQEKHSKGMKEYMLITPKGMKDAGALAYVRVNPNSKKTGLGTSVNFSIMKGPYDDAYHRQMLNDKEGVEAILGRSARKSVLPVMNSVLSEIILNTDWEIMKLK